MKTEMLDDIAEILVPWSGNCFLFGMVCSVLTGLFAMLGRSDMAEMFLRLALIAFGAGGFTFFGFTMFRLLFEERKR